MTFDVSHLKINLSFPKSGGVSWGYFSGNYAMAWKYPKSTFKDQSIAIDYLDRLKSRKLDSEGESKKYFYYSGMYNLIIEDESKDDCSNYTYNQLFRALTSSNVDDLSSFATAFARVTNRRNEIDQIKDILAKDCKK